MSEWEAVTEQPLSDWLMPHERADLERAASQAIVGFVPRAELKITTQDDAHMKDARNHRAHRASRAAYRRRNS